ncbi:putative secreted protein [Candidatus Protofrankia californiensis]|uniref:Putative secreted protein n=2 Tax=Protofrankia TaxID=2994361 RepID=A0A1C3P843_9ACTN|nr:putative secreted protein [Candidatus Protofrankia californiensis]
MTMCQVCPVCRLATTLAAGRPEAAVHLFAAATSLAAAVRAILADRPNAGGDGAAAAGAGRVDDTARRGRTTERPGSGSRVQRIDVE